MGMTDANLWEARSSRDSSYEHKSKKPCFNFNLWPKSSNEEPEQPVGKEERRRREREEGRERDTEIEGEREPAGDLLKENENETLREKENENQGPEHYPLFGPWPARFLP